MYARLDASIAACTLSGLALVGCLRYAALFVKKLENKIRRTPGLTISLEKHVTMHEKGSARQKSEG